MFDRPEILRLAESMANHAAGRQARVAENIANADTPGFRARDLPAFLDVYSGASSQMHSTRPGHLSFANEMQRNQPIIDASAEPAPNGNSVSLETEMIRQADVRRQHDMALAVYKSSLDLIRTALGRGR